MGIPKFARFLIERYPLILKKIKGNTDIPEIDNFYLDVNGVIHKRAHNNSIILMCKERSLDDIFYDIFRYIDEMVHLIKPKKFLMISADGVAPRAKMNQQRTRRYRKTDVDPKEIEALRRQGLDPEKMFNSDCISAGTEFMFKLSKSFDVFVKEKMKTDPLWKDLKVILTGVEVPGEGEHKIIEYIRNFKNSNDYVNNTKHCIYGLDADLIMLSLITHEPNICILREEVFKAKKSATDSVVRSVIKISDSFEFIYVSVLREYLELEFLEIKPKLKFEYNIERIIDDFVFFCFFIGNDFLPNLNTLDIDHGALDNIFLYYKQVLPSLDDYITFHGRIDFNKAEKIFECLSNHEINNITSMLRNVEKICSERDKKKFKALQDRKKLLRAKKIMSKKENFLIVLKEKDERSVINFKKDKISKKINNFRTSYETELKLRGKEVKFQEDIKIYMKEELNKQIKEIHNRKSQELIEETNEDKELNIIPKQDSLVSRTDDNNANSNSIASTVTTINTTGLINLFDSDEERTNKSPKKYFKKNEKINNNINNDNLSYIMKEASKYHRYILDDNYCSDINIDDIDEEDIGIISEPELNSNIDTDPKSEKEIADNQDMDKIFQQKLLNLYIKDVNEAKAFYYKEKLGIDLSTFEGQQEHKKMFKKYLEGLQWVLYYYYRGIQSWRWYYPYHYAPMISDFNKIKQYLDYNIDNTFTPDEPFTPFQSLLFILPKKSRVLYPKCYWSVFDEYPELFPDKFQIDFNGKKMPWESLVLLPFIPEEIIIVFERNKWEKYKSEKIELIKEEESSLILTDYEVERNYHGNSYIYKYNTSTCEIDRNKYEIYQGFSGITNSNYITKTVDYTFPSLKTINYDYTFLMKKQYIGKHKDQFKNKKVLQITPKMNNTLLGDEKIKAYVANQVIYINYPFKQEAIIRGIVYNNQYFYLNNYNKVVVDNRKTIQAELRDSIKSEWYKKGISFQYCGILCEVSLFKHFGRKCDGSIFKVYEETYYYVPFEITSLNSHLSDFSILNQNFQVLSKIYSNIESEFSKDHPALILSKVSNGNLGMITNIITCKNNNKYDKFNEENYTKYYDKYTNYDLEGSDWEVPLHELYSGPLIEVEIKNKYQSSLVTDNNFGKSILQTSQEEFITLNEVAKKLSISDWTLGLLTSSIFVINCTSEDEINDDAKVSELEHWNIGLNMKSRSKYEKLILPGYTRYNVDPNNYGDSFCWEFSQKAVQLIFEYKEKFPFVFDSLEKYKNLYIRSNKFFRVYELFSTLDNFIQKLNDVAIWINSNKISTCSFSSSRSNFLSINDCMKIEEFISNKNNILKNNLKGDFIQHLVLNPNYIFQESLPKIYPFIAYEPNPFYLGDRVVNICSSDQIFIPFGLKGTVTAYTDEFIEVLFDCEFFGGSDFNGRFSSKKAAYVKPLNLINLTNKHPIYLRRNHDKYISWDFVPSYTNYDDYFNTYALSNSKSSSQLNLNTKKSDEHKQNKREKRENNSNSITNVSTTQQPKIIQKNKNTKINPNFVSNSDKNTSTNFVNKNNQTVELTKNSNSVSSYVPKRIITKDKTKINSAFKTNPEGAIVTEDVHIINNESRSTNVAEYRNERIFSNENLKRQELYFYSFGEGNLENLRENNKIIIRKMNNNNK